jgi:uncharacterized protein YbjT (DUF2867 family)
MHLVLGVSGNTGKVVAETLLAAGKSVRVLVRDAKKGEPWKARGAEVAMGGIDDESALAGALRGAEAAYLLLPPHLEAANPAEENARRTRVFEKALRASPVKHVVFLSSIGAQHDHGTGPILSVHDAETVLGQSRDDVTFLRAGYFMENWGGSLYALGQGKLPTFLTADRPFPMVATHDIGTTAAKLLLEGGRGKRVVELAGPREYSPRDTATALSEIVGKPITVEQGPVEAMAAALEGAGMNPAWARLYQELTLGVNTGVVDWEKGRARERGVTELKTVLSKLVPR